MVILVMVTLIMVTVVMVKTVIAVMVLDDIDGTGDDGYGTGANGYDTGDHYEEQQVIVVQSNGGQIMHSGPTAGYQLVTLSCISLIWLNTILTHY